MISPVDHLQKYMRRYPNTGKLIEKFMNGRGSDLPDWPKWCFLPMGAFYSIVKAQHGDNFNVWHISDVPILSALGTWRYSQGIYRIHPDLLIALAASTIFGDLPANVLHRLPEWCVYIETPGLTWQGKGVHGFFAHMEWDVNTGREELRLLLNYESGKLIPAILHVGSWTVEEAVRRAVEESVRQAKAAGLKFTGEALKEYEGDLVQYLSEELSGLISILLYLSSESPEIAPDREPGKSVSRPEPVRVKGGWRYFPPSQPRVIHVGEQVGERLRVQSLTGADVRNGTKKRAHLRRGHWHGYWTGPRNGARKFVYRWIPPLIVGGKNES